MYQTCRFYKINLVAHSYGEQEKQNQEVKKTFYRTLHYGTFWKK